MKCVKAISVCALGLFSVGATAAKLSVALEIPEMQVSEYHRPYVAVWVENEQRTPVAQVALWLEQEKWHRDLRSWWRRGGRTLALPVDGVSGATRKPGRYELHHNLSLTPGHYWLNVEAVREVGGREHVKFPIHWTGTPVSATQQGSSELGAVSFSISE